MPASTRSRSGGGRRPEPRRAGRRRVRPGSPVSVRGHADRHRDRAPARRGGGPVGSAHVQRPRPPQRAVDGDAGGDPRRGRGVGGRPGGARHRHRGSRRAGVRRRRRHLRVRRPPHRARGPRRLRPALRRGLAGVAARLEAGHRQDRRLLHRRRSADGDAGRHPHLLGAEHVRRPRRPPRARLRLRRRAPADAPREPGDRRPRSCSRPAASRRRRRCNVGLVNRVVPVDELEAAVVELAGQIARNAPLTIAACKAAIRLAAEGGRDVDTTEVDALAEACFRIARTTGRARPPSSPSASPSSAASDVSARARRPRSCSISRSPEPVPTAVRYLADWGARVLRIEQRRRARVDPRRPRQLRLHQPPPLEAADRAGPARRRRPAALPPPRRARRRRSWRTTGRR